ncbi:Potassium voltage-gated channel KQT possible potassium channel VIC family [Furfurilactobacillus rossiae]|uniref:potassium channel family protein n=1 Tax=Furfurilactobacillus rossiae TaxID=231049 RepID=UPI0015BC65E7|nr:potassium channel family protein [Furfurilactobacillus rossiae]MCF6166751.1 potassium channel family protein [Furfurilactobacillus rossiae]QLE63801.1 Potassium voltage-gated channel KQT possible potassium channel VIC family [Furfurilactobacillus rossiae]
MKSKSRIFSQFYQLFIIVLAIISVVLTLFDLTGEINLSLAPYSIIDTAIWCIFVVDYIVGLFSATSKQQYFKAHVMDLLAIIPVNAVFNLFRFARIFRIIRLLRIFRMAGIIGKLQDKLRNFLQTNGFIYLLYASIAILLVAASVYATVEKISFGNALWWAITTATTVGYGDISPHTVIGKIVAITLMLIGVGFVGMLTSTLTTYFTKKSQRKTAVSNDELLHEIKQLHEENQLMQQEIRELNTFIKRED